MNVFSSILDRLERVSIVAAIIFLLMMGVLMNVEIFSRTLFGRSTQIADEFSGYFFTAITLLCFVPTLRHGRFLRVEAFVDRLPVLPKTVLKVAGALVGALMSGVLTYTTFGLAWTSWTYGTLSLEAVQVPLAIPQAILPVGFGLLCLAFVEQAVLAIVHHGASEGEPPPDILHGLD